MRRNKLQSASGLVLIASLCNSLPAAAVDAGAFVGGMLTSRVLHNMIERTQAEQQQAYYAQQQAQAQQQQAQQVQQAPAASSGSSVESRLADLDTLAAGGSITPEEYKAKKQQILDSI